MLRSASILVSGSVLAQLISLILQPFLRRSFPAEVWGIFAEYLSLIGIILSVSSFRFDDAIVLPKNDKESANVLSLSLIFSFLFDILLFIIVLVMGDRIIVFLNLPPTFPVWILYIIPFSAFLYNSYQCLNYWLVRKQKFLAVSANKLARRSSEGVFQISFGLLRNSNGLIYSDIIGQTVNLVTVIFQTIKNGLTFRNVSLTKIKYVFKKYKYFPKYNLVPAFMSTCSYMLPPIFINKFFSNESAGYFDLAKLLLSVPLAFVATSFSSVLLQKVTEKFNKRESFMKDLQPVLLVAGIISIAEILVIVFFGEYLFKLVGGSDWVTSGKISKIMVWSFAFNFIVSSFTSVFVSMRKIKTYSVYQLFYFLAIVSLLFFKSLPFNEFLRIYVIIEIICYTILTAVLVYTITSYELALNKNTI